MSRTPCNAVADHQGATDPWLKTPDLKSDVWKYFGFWSVDGKLVEPTAKVVCKLELAYHSTTSYLRLHLQNVHPSEYGIICGTSAKQPRLDRYFVPSATSSLSAAQKVLCCHISRNCVPHFI